jgi:hypothetical protein
MTPIVQTPFTEELLQLLKETFEGPAPTGPSPGTTDRVE